MRQERRKLEETRRGETEHRRPARPAIPLDGEIQKFDDVRRRLLLEFFIGHFLKMAEKSNIFR